MDEPKHDQWVQQILACNDLLSLRIIRHQIRSHFLEQLDDSAIGQFYMNLNSLHDRLIAQTVMLAEHEMARLGHGLPPVPYAYLLFGSAGRMEQTFSSDQDSGLLYDDTNYADKQFLTTYFSQLAQLVVSMLQQLGYPPCEGNVISTNPTWNLSLEQWKNNVTTWIDDPIFDYIRYLLILADSRAIHGESELLRSLKDHFYTLVQQNRTIEQHLLSNTMRYKVLVGLFGQLLREQYGEEAGSLDIKYGAYIPMVNAIRLLAIRENIQVTSTLQRLSQLIKKRIFTDDEGHSYQVAFETFLTFRLLAKEHEEDGLYSNNGKLPKIELTPERIKTIKQSLKLGKQLQKFVVKKVAGKQSMRG